jgi:phage tail-like protein
VAPDPVSPLLARAFRFRVSLLLSPPAGDKSQPMTLGDGGFQECSGLDLEMDVQDLPEGGRNHGSVRLVGRAKLQPLVLKRGMFVPRPQDRARGAGAGVDPALWRWIQDIVTGVRPVRRYNGVVEVLDAGTVVVARWTFERGLPARVAGPQLNARTGEIAIEELHIHHQGLRLEAV